MEENPIHLGAFSILAKPVRKALSKMAFSEPTAPQVEAIPAVLQGRNVLLVAPTGSGKTEAVLLPVFSNFIRQPDKKGISILYITPLRALNRDMIRRLSFWASSIGFSVEVRHGDTELKIRRRQALQPPNMLVTTPETLQAILPGSRMQKHLSHVRHVIIDEVHQLAENKRGVQLAIALERLSEIAGKDFQRVGLSATIGNPKKVAKFVAGTHRSIKVIEVPLPKGYQYNVEYPMPLDVDYDLAHKLRTPPEAAARIRRIFDLVKGHTSTLIFVNSRTNAEMLGHKFNQLTSDIAVHHGSLSKEERRNIEDDFKEKILKAIVCTSTLELGIDVGHVDLVIQYLSPREVSSLIQRVGRSGHKLNLISKGILVTAFSDDVLEAVAAIQLAKKGQLEPITIHDNALDVLAHQLVGILLDQRMTSIDDVLGILRQAYPYRSFSKARLLDIVDFLHRLREIRREGDTLKKTRRTRQYYYENLSMIPDERRYPIVDILSDRTIGTLGDEFMALRARIGLNFICRGKVWRIVQIEDETRTVFVVPSEDPTAAIPGWDGEMLPIPFSLAQHAGKLRKAIAKELKHEKKLELAAEKLARKFATSKSTMLKPVEEISEHLKRGAPLPTDDHVLIEAFDKYVIIHACFGEVVNRTLGSIFDSILSDQELITGWWNDGYRILIEMSRKAELEDLERLPSLLFELTSKEVIEAFEDYLKARFPFAYKMKFVAERFGALPRGRTMLGRRLAQLPRRFKKTPVYDETLREARTERVDIPRVKQIMKSFREGTIKVSTLFCLESPTPLGYHILAKYSDIPELMAPEPVLLSNIERMKKAILARTAALFCFSCNNLVEKRIRELPESLTCEKCGAGLLACLRLGQDPKELGRILERRVGGKELGQDELEELTHARRTADLVLSHGRKALIALQVKGIGPETAFRILGKMHPNDDDFYMDLLKAKIQYLRTRPYWEERQEERRIFRQS